MIDFFLDGPGGREELRLQAQTARVVARCSCGCPSVWLEVDPSAPVAVFDEAERPSGTGWVSLSAFQEDPVTAQVTLHVIVGRLEELEVWAGYGIKPIIDVKRLKRARP